MGCDPRKRSRKPKMGIHDTLNQWKFKKILEPWPNDFHVDEPLIGNILHKIGNQERTTTTTMTMTIFNTNNPSLTFVL